MSETVRAVALMDKVCTDVRASEASRANCLRMVGGSVKSFGADRASAAMDVVEATFSHAVDGRPYTMYTYKKDMLEVNLIRNAAAWLGYEVQEDESDTRDTITLPRATIFIDSSTRDARGRAAALIRVEAGG